MKRRTLVSLEALLLVSLAAQFDIGVLTRLSRSLLRCDRQHKEERDGCLELYRAIIESGKCAITQTEHNLNDTYYTSYYVVGESRAFHGGTFCFPSASACQTEVILLRAGPTTRC